MDKMDKDIKEMKEEKDAANAEETGDENKQMITNLLITVITTAALVISLVKGSKKPNKEI